MNEKILLAYFIIQILVQYILYAPIRNKLFDYTSEHPDFIKTLPIALFVTNLGVSVFVLAFTGRGGATGMSNTFASVILGIVMAIQYAIFEHKLFSGAYEQEKARKQKKMDEIDRKIARYQRMIEYHKRNHPTGA